jgi:hypothetical protein
MHHAIVNVELPALVLACCDLRPNIPSSCQVHMPPPSSPPPPTVQHACCMRRTHCCCTQINSGCSGPRLLPEWSAALCVGAARRRHDLVNDVVEVLQVSRRYSMAA